MSSNRRPVAACRCEPADRRAQRVRAEAAALDPLGHRDVEGHRAVLRLGLLHEAEPADQLAVELDGPSVAVHAQVLAQPLRLVGLAPPACNARLADYLRQWLEICFGQGPGAAPSPPGNPPRPSPPT